MEEMNSYVDRISSLEPHLIGAEPSRNLSALVESLTFLNIYSLGRRYEKMLHSKLMLPLFLEGYSFLVRHAYVASPPMCCHVAVGTSRVPHCNPSLLK